MWNAAVVEKVKQMIIISNYLNWKQLSGSSSATTISLLTSLKSH